MSTRWWSSPAGGGFTVNKLDALAVEQQLHFVRLGQAFDVLVAVAREADLDLVLGVEREGVADGQCRRACRAAARRSAPPG